MSNQIKDSSMTYGRILKLFGHISSHDNTEKLIMQQKPEGKKKIGATTYPLR